MEEILQILLVLAIFLPIKWLTYQITDVWGLPSWLNYKPFNCYICLTFWTLVAAYVTAGIALHLWITMIGGIIMATLNAIAMHIDQKNKTISAEDLEK